MFSISERAGLKRRLIETAEADRRVIGAALLGSSASGAQDAWSDIDIALCVEDEHRADVVLDWTNEMYAEHGAVHTVSQINPSAFRQVATFRVGIGADAIVFGDRSLWIANITDETVSRIDPATGTVATIALAGARPE